MKPKRLKKTSGKVAKYYEIGAAGAGEADVLVFGDIGETWWSEGITAKQFADEIAALDVDTINVYINSYGGSVLDGLGIFNALKRHSATINVFVEGMAVSVASLIAMAGDTVSIASNGLLMIHAPWGGVQGNSKKVREYADVLDKHAEAMAISYETASGKSHADIMAILTDGADHWYTADEAVEAGFADSITAAVEGDEDTTRAGLNRFNRFLPTAIAAAYNPTEGNTMQTEAQIKAAKEQADRDEAERLVKAETETRIEAAKVEERKLLTARNVQIRSNFEAFSSREGVSSLLGECIADGEQTIEGATALLLKHLGKDVEALGTSGHVSVGEEAVDKFKGAAQSAILVRAGLVKRDDEGENNYRGYSLYEIARAALEFVGVNTRGMGRMELVAAAFTHSTSDFTSLLANTANKSMLKGWEEAEETFQQWTSRGQLSDFKVVDRVDLNEFSSLAEVRAGAEFKFVTIGDRKEQVQLATYGNRFSIDRQSIINDDLGAFTRIPQKFGRAAIRTVGDLVYAILTGNPAMQDAVTLFHADHSNVTTGVMTTATIDAMQVLFGLQTDPDGNVTALNIPMKYVIVPLASRGLAKTIRDSEKEVLAAKTATTPNSVRGTFEVVADGRLDADSSVEYYGAADPNSHDTIEVSYLDGNDQPYLEQQDGWSVDGAEFKVRIDAVAKALDHRGLAYSTGAA